MTSNEFRCGFAALCGRTNAGKSTLVNALTKELVSITSHKVQTTRQNIRAILNLEERAQIIVVDTPGIHLWQKRELNRVMHASAMGALHDADVRIMIIDAGKALDKNGELPEIEKLIVEELKKNNNATILVINKIDTLPSHDHILPIIEKYKDAYPFDHIQPVSALKHVRLEELTEILAQSVPVAPALFPAEYYTDAGERDIVSEIIRGKIIQNTQNELPYSTIVEIEDYKVMSDQNLVSICATIFVERESQKAILIGKKGDKIKELGTLARKSIAFFLQSRVYLDLKVKIKENWPENLKKLKEHGLVPDGYKK